MKELKSDRPRRSPSKSNTTFVTRSGKTIKVNRNLNDRLKAGREAKARKKAAYLSSLPAEPWKRVLYRLDPRRAARYWFSREGGIMALKLAGVGFVVLFLLIVGVFAYFRKDLPKIKDVAGNNFGGSITYYDRTGQTLLYQDYNAKKRVPVEDKNISKYMKQATIAIEDKNFFEHGAFDTKGIMRALVNEAKGSSGGRQGGSTITQQLVKLSEGWENERTVSRKIKELILAVELEREYSKKDILTGYLNMAPYGNVDYGVETAAQDYFGISAKELSIPQSAMLAAIPKAPGSLSPYSSPEYNKSLGANYFDKEWLLDRKDYIINLMRDQKYISAKEAEAAKKVDVLAQIKPRQDKYANIKAPYFVVAARDELYKTFPKKAVENGGWKVITTVDMGLQALAEKSVVTDNVRRLTNGGADNTAFVAEDNATGQVVAIVGGTDFNTKQVSFATEAQISPGSSIKPYTYATLIDSNSNVGAGSYINDKQSPLPGYVCSNKNIPDRGGNCLFNFTRRYYGNVTLRYALGGSLNVPAVKAFTSVVQHNNIYDINSSYSSINKVLSTINGLMSQDHGYKCYPDGTVLSEATPADESQCGPAAGIGDGAYLTLADHTNGIASLARLGKSIPQTTLLKVTNSSGKTLKEFKQPTGKQVIKADSAYIVSDMAADPGASYLSGSCGDTNCSSSGMKFHRYKGWRNSIKTGTTNNRTDGLMVSWNGKYSAAIWIGNYDRSEFTVSPENVTQPAMRSFMQGAIDALGAVAPQNLAEPAGIKKLPSYPSAVPFGTQSRPPATDLFPSWYVGKSSGGTAVLDKVSGKVATSCTPEAARQTFGGSTSASLNVDIYSGGSPGSAAPTSTSNDDVHKCSDSKPSVSITAVNGTAGGSGSTLSCPAAGCVIMVHVEQGTFGLSDSARPNFPGTLSLLVNGQSVQSQAVNASGDYQFTFQPPADSADTLQVSVQITDSVLYQGTDAATLTIVKPATTSGSGPGNGNNGNSNNPNNPNLP